MMHLKRVYDPAGPADGTRILVERLWPRGVKKAALPMDRWAKDAAPSDELRRWFHHDPKKWEEFRRRYVAELEAHPAAWTPILDTARVGDLTLLYSSHDTDHSNAVALREFLQGKLDQGLAPAGPAAGLPGTPLGEAA